MEYAYDLFLYIAIFSNVLFPYILGDVTIEINTESKYNCTCVPYYQCTDDFDDLITDGKGLLDARLMTNSSCKGYLDVCCTATETALFPPPEPPQKIFGCGYQNKGFFPWYAALFLQLADNLPPTYKCGVSLINPKAVLTAAHCINRDGNWSIRVGNAFRRVSKKIIHPKFNNATLYNDIALVILKDPIEISEKINTLCIASPGTTLDNTRCRATATSTVFEGRGSYLRMLKVPIVAREMCLKMLRSTRLGPFFQLHSSFLCAGGDKLKNTCVGDGGSPLVCPVPGQPERYHQVGIVSWGIGCGDNNVPDVYVKLSIFRDWIDSEMIKNGLEITTYRY